MLQSTGSATHQEQAHNLLEQEQPLLNQEHLNHQGNEPQPLSLGHLLVMLKLQLNLVLHQELRVAEEVWQKGAGQLLQCHHIHISLAVEIIESYNLSVHHDVVLLSINFVFRNCPVYVMHYKTLFVKFLVLFCINL